MNIRVLFCFFTFVVMAGACTDGDVISRQTPALMVLNNDLLDFDDVPIDTAVVRTIRVLNSGQMNLSITGVSFDGEGAQAFSVNEDSFSLTGETSAYMNITFQPSDIKDYVATLTFESNSSDDKGQSISLSGTGVSATICGDCDNPPSSTCLSETTLLLYDNRGTCVEGACEYHARTVECESGCNEETGRCNDDEGNEPAPPDRDDDGIPDDTDPCPDDPTNDDPDGDGICADDNCPNDANPDQVDADGDGLGNVCDPCPTEATNDQDEDGICDSVDNCVSVPNSDQSNVDGDEPGDACDLCPELPAREHLDLNANGVGDECEFQVAMNHYQACVLSDAGAIECWGADNDILTCATPGACGTDSPGAPTNAVQISLGRDHGCAVVEGGAVQCWGTGTGAVTPEGLFWSVQSNDYMNCGIKRDNSIHCWGLGDDGDAPSNQTDWTTFYEGVPAGEYFDVRVNGYGACALKLNGDATCWGQAVPPLWADPPADTAWDRIDFIYQHACGVTSENAMSCWGFIPVTNPEGTFEKVGVGFEDNCALKTDGTAYCWGNNGSTGTSALNTIPDATEVYWNLHMSTSAACGVRLDGKLRCWGTGTDIIENIPSSYQVD